MMMTEGLRFAVLWQLVASSVERLVAAPNGAEHFCR